MGKMRDGQSSSKHVLVLAISMFPRADEQGIVNLKKTIYEYRLGGDAGGEGQIEYTCEGYYQLDPIPQFIREYMEESITDIIMLTTKETSQQEGKTYKVRPCPDTTGQIWEGKVVDYFRERMQYLLTDKQAPAQIPDFHEIPVDPMKAAEALEKVMDKIRTLYEQTDKTGESWRLWIDTHGGFRDVSLVLTSAARFFAVETQKEPIKTDGIFSVLHSQEKGVRDVIADQTAFYFTESADAMRQFLTYGQYLTRKFTPHMENNAFAFVSYSHDPGYLTHVRTLFTVLDENAIPFWFDDQIRYLENWRGRLEERNASASIFIGLLSTQYFQSVECWKELMQAFHRNTEGHFFLLEERLNITEIVRTALQDPAIAAVAGETPAEEICKYLGADRQCIQWYRYMQQDRGIHERKLLEDDDLAEVISSIQRSLKQADQVRKEQGRPFVNFSNHPSEGWSPDQQKEALSIGDTIVDVPFPMVDPHDSDQEIQSLARIFADQIIHLQPAAVMCQGEFTLAYNVTKILMDQGIRVLAACAVRDVEEVNGERRSRFTFVRFRDFADRL